MALDIALVAARNGLGHARRLLHLASGLIELNTKVSLLLTLQQSELLKSEILSLANNMQNLSVIIIPKYGPDTLNFSHYIPDAPQPDREIIRTLSRVKVVISDNSLWPAQYSNSFFILGHFTWQQYWSKSSDEARKRFRPETSSEYDYKSFNRVINWFRTDIFGWDTPAGLSSTDIPILRYRSDKAIGEVKESLDAKAEVWHANGTTSLNVVNTKHIKGNRLKLINRETFRMSTSNSRPLLVVGRPGMGTIRDCLAHSVPFLPLWSGEDPELERNSQILKELDLTPRAVIITEPLSKSETNFEILALKSKMFQLTAFWDKYSASATSVAQLILDKIRYCGL